MTDTHLPPLPSAVPLPVVFMQMVNGYWISQAIFVAAKLGIADLLEAGPQRYEEIAAATGADARSIYRLLRALASLGIFSEVNEQKFALTPLAQFLRSNAPGSLRAMAIMSGEEHYRAWGELLYSVKTGNDAFSQVYGLPIFPYLAQNPESAQIFDQAMTSYSSLEIGAVVASYDFSALDTLVDVGGGNGSLLTALLQANLHLKGILFDQETVVAGATPILAAGGVSDRCQVVAGNFFESVPTGGKAYLLKHIIHDWGDTEAIAILQHCRIAMPAEGRLLLVEMVIQPGNDPFIGKLLDLNMLTMCPGGCERTEAEYRTLLAQAGFQLTRIVPTSTFASIIEAIPLATQIPPV
ncbi:MAG: methyltransferase [Thermosynechococcaceae cyanobacterium]